MNKYWIDFNGYFQVDATTEEEARQKAEILMDTLYDIFENLHLDIDRIEKDCE